MRNRHFLLIDLVLLALLPFALFALRMESTAWSPDIAKALASYSVIVLPARLLVAYSSGLYRFIWRYASMVELERLIYAGAVGGVVTFLTGTVVITSLGLAPTRLPYGFLIEDAVFAFGVLAAPRLAYRMLNRSPSLRSPAAKRTLIVGAGAVGQAILREMRVGQMSLDVIGFVDDDLYKKNQLLGGAPVLGTLADLPVLVRRHAVDEVIIAIAAVRGSVVRGVVQALAGTRVETRIVPGIRELIIGEVQVQSLRRVEIEDLLRRDPIATDLAAVCTLAEGRIVLVTGAGGSIGSELCRQIAALKPLKLVVLDHSENQIFEISRELRTRFVGLQLAPVIADIRDAARIRSILELYNPHAIFHAAAHKHVPLMEDNVIEAITNNVLGTRNVVDAALDAGTERLVNISTDKAVRPTSVMGATKRIAEKIVANAALTENRNFVSVRFGNVLGSRGSVIPTFLKQIGDGGPITVTHPEMRRYFMTIPEAVQLVLQAGALGSGGELFVLDMGEPIKIADLARDLIRLSGLEEGADIEIEYTGVRPGEKLYEEVLVGSEDIRPTNHPKVLRAVGEAAEPELSAAVEALIRSAATHPTTDAYLRDQLRKLVPEFAREDARTDPKLRPSPASGVKPPRPAVST
jgi:FlaA1/EpsC-like NDP-sugar epimerase